MRRENQPPPLSPSRQRAERKIPKTGKKKKAKTINPPLPPRNSLRHENCELAGPTFYGSIAPVFVSNLLSHHLLAHYLPVPADLASRSLLSLPCFTLTLRSEYLVPLSSLSVFLFSRSLRAFACSTTEEERAALVSAPRLCDPHLEVEVARSPPPPTRCGGLHKLAFPRSLPA